MSASIARPYAAAAFARAKDADEATKWSRYFSALLLSEQDIIRAVRAAPGGQPALAQSLAEAMEADSEFSNFLKVAASYGRLECLGDMARQFAKLHAEDRGVLDMEVETAHEMDLNARRDFDRALEKWSGKRVRVVYRVNPALLGGVRVYSADNVLDASILGRLDRLTAALN